MELARLSAVLPHHIKLELHNSNGPRLLDTTTGTETNLADCRSASEALADLLHNTLALGHAQGRTDLASRILPILSAPHLCSNSSDPTTQGDEGVAMGPHRGAHTERRARTMPASNTDHT